jgi:hypothetical protein
MAGSRNTIATAVNAQRAAFFEWLELMVSRCVSEGLLASARTANGNSNGNSNKSTRMSG